MPREIVYRPHNSRPDLETLARDIEGRWWRVYQGGELVCVCDSRVKYVGPDVSDEPILASQDLEIDWTTAGGVMADVLSMADAGGALDHVGGMDLAVWRGMDLAAVVYQAGSTVMMLDASLPRPGPQPRMIIFESQTGLRPDDD
jgi:hypothetical protein